MIKKKTISLFLTLALMLSTMLAIPTATYATIDAPSNGAQFELGEQVDIKYTTIDASDRRENYCEVIIKDSNEKEVSKKTYTYDKKGSTIRHYFTPSELGKYTITVECYCLITSYIYNGTAVVGSYTDAYTFSTETSTFEVIKAKKANPLKVKAKTATVKYSKLKKKNQTLAVGKVMSFTKKGQGKITYVKVSGNKKITINKTTGKVTAKKGLKKGAYKVKAKVKAAGNSKYKPITRTVTFKIRVR